MAVRMHQVKCLLLLSAIAICVSASHFLDAEWNVWTSKYGRQYKDLEEEQFRRTAWEANWERVQKHNQLADQGLSKYWMAVNHFADMTNEELRSKSCLIYSGEFSKPSNIPQKSLNAKNPNIPEEVDWRKSNCITPVKNQGNCGSCWAFAAIGVVESRLCLKNGNLVQLSEQQLVDCDTSDSGCCGGMPLLALQYVTEKGVMKSQDYEYTQKKFTCLYKPDEAITLNVTKYYGVPGEDNIASSVASEGPIIVGFGVDTEFFFYVKGVYDGSCAPYPNHAIIIVGYGTEYDKNNEDNNEDYWLIKNSWGEQWADEGYGKIKRNVNKCSIADMAATIDLQ
ncbi:uncharacterized protein LOC128492263 [Spea bombifrons]|uniref:uncharacterized protein LOC128492263 n=1 Tax=Spea bombifrons TaxID=233779 RepID=UPI00234BCC60|nr:uncharacterized protein LOC128492263 [Spea bombifrons]